MTPLVSVVIPTYDGGHYLRETVASALAQDLEDIEVVVVDDGSHDDVAPLLAPFSDRVRLIRQHRQGPGASRNTGARESRGEFIAFLDHDDLWAPTKLSEQVRLMRTDPRCGLVYSYPVLIDAEGHTIANTPPSSFPSGDVFAAFLARNRITTFSATLLRRSAYTAIGGIDESAELLTCDDYDLWLRVAHDYTVRHCPGELVYYRVHAASLIRNYMVNVNAHLAVLDRWAQRIEASHQGEDAELLRRCIHWNRYRTYRKAGLRSYFSHPPRNAEARRALLNALHLNHRDLRCVRFLLATVPPLCWLRTLRHHWMHHADPHSDGDQAAGPDIASLVQEVVGHGE